MIQVLIWHSWLTDSSSDTMLLANRFKVWYYLILANQSSSETALWPTIPNAKCVPHAISMLTRMMLMAARQCWWQWQCPRLGNILTLMTKWWLVPSLLTKTRWYKKWYLSWQWQWMQGCWHPNNGHLQDVVRSDWRWQWQWMQECCHPNKGHLQIQHGETSKHNMNEKDEAIQNCGGKASTRHPNPRRHVPASIWVSKQRRHHFCPVHYQWHYLGNDYESYK